MRQTNRRVRLKGWLPQQLIKVSPGSEVNQRAQTAVVWLYQGRSESWQAPWKAVSQRKDSGELTVNENNRLICLSYHWMYTIPSTSDKYCMYMHTGHCTQDAVYKFIIILHYGWKLLYINIQKFYTGTISWIVAQHHTYSVYLIRHFDLKGVKLSCYKKIKNIKLFHVYMSWNSYCDILHHYFINTSKFFQSLFSDQLLFMPAINLFFSTLLFILV